MSVIRHIQSLRCEANGVLSRDSCRCFQQYSILWVLNFDSFHNISPLYVIIMEFRKVKTIAYKFQPTDDQVIDQSGGTREEGVPNIHKFCDLDVSQCLQSDHLT